MYRYYSTQRPISIGTFPNGLNNRPVNFENFMERICIGDGLFMAWGYLEYKSPLTEEEIYEYELRALDSKN